MTRSAVPIDRAARLAATVASLTGWRLHALAAACGALATLALPPVHLVVALAPAFAGLAWLIAAAPSPRRAFAVGWLFGIGHFATGLYWVSHALLVEPTRFGWMIPFALVGLGGGLGLFSGAAAAAAWGLARRGIVLPLALAAAWLGAEWLRGHVLTGFPWNLAGTAWAGLPPIAGLAAFLGLYGLTALTVAVAALAGAARPALRHAALAAFALAQVLHLLWPVLAPSRGDVAALDRPRLRLVQPDIPQSLKWDPRERQAHLQLTADLSLAPGVAAIDHVLWPETATLFPLDGDAAFRRNLAALVPPRGYLLAGSTRVERTPRLQVWNSLHALDGDGEIRATYDKFHLVPFGEYAPLRGVLPIDKLAVGPVDFSAGPGPRTLRLPGLPPFSPLICYESIFPGAVRDPADRPDWILVATNDAWFGASAGPHQHFAAAVFRAIEEGLPVVRVANGGMSGVIDARGHVLAALPLGARTHLDVVLPPPLPPPLYARLGDGLLLALAALLLALGRIGRDAGMAPPPARC